MSEKNRQRVGVSKTMWRKLGPAGQAACARMWDDMKYLETLEPRIAKLSNKEQRTLRCNIAISAGVVVREMKIDEKAGIALWEPLPPPPSLLLPGLYVVKGKCGKKRRGR